MSDQVIRELAERMAEVGSEQERNRIQRWLLVEQRRAIAFGDAPLANTVARIISMIRSGEDQKILASVEAANDAGDAA